MPAIRLRDPSLSRNSENALNYSEVPIHKKYILLEVKWNFQLMQLTRFTDYSLRTLMYLAVHHNRRCTVKEIAKYYDISQNHLVKVAHNLSQIGYIRSIKGKGGGIELLHKPSEINLRDLIVTLEPHFSLVECFDAEKNTCRVVSGCELQKILSESLQAFLAELEKYTIADTISDKQSFLIPVANI